MGSKCMPKIRSMNIAKFDSRIHGSSTFETAKGSKINEKSMQNHVKIEHQLESNLGPILERFWTPNRRPTGSQETSQTASKFDQNLIGFNSILEEGQGL